MPTPTMVGMERLEDRTLFSADISTGPADFFLAAVGEPSGSLNAQTFTTEQDGFADELTFQLQPAGSPLTDSFNPVNFNVLVAEVDVAPSSGPFTDLIPTNIVFESDTFSLPPGDGTQPPTDVVVDLQGLELTAGVEYAFFINTLDVFDGLTDSANLGVITSDFAGGQAFFTGVVGTGESFVTDGATFVGGDIFGTPDIAFSLTFLTAPTAALAGPIAGIEGQSVRLDASASTDPDDDIVLFEFDTDFDGVTFNAGLPDLGAIAGGLAFSGPAAAPGGGVFTLDGLADLAPGDYLFRVTATDDDGGVSQATAELTVAAEDATAVYTGPEAVSTEAGSNAGAFSIELRAFVAEDFDGSAGDLSTADVAPSADDPTSDVVTATFTGELGIGVEDLAFTVEVLVGGNYVCSDVAFLNVARPDSSRAFGFGSIIEENAQGGQVEVQNYYGGTETIDLSIADDSRVRFGFFADFRRDNLAGGFRAVFQAANGDFFLLTSTDLTSFTTQVDPDGDAATRDFSASLIGTARLVNLSTGQFTDTLTLEVDVTDNRTRGIDDTIAFSLFDGDDLALSSNFDGIDTVEQDFDRGGARVVAG